MRDPTSEKACRGQSGLLNEGLVLVLLLLYTGLNLDDLSNVFQRNIYVSLVGYLREHPHRKKRARNVKVIC